MAFPGGTPNEFYRYNFKQGDSGWDVAALQITLTDVYAQHPDQSVYNLVVDGSFGPKTNAAVLDWQKKHPLTVDGIAGIGTQMSLCVGISSPSEKKYSLPTWLLKGIVEGESGYAVAAVTPSYDNGSRDYGAYQDNIQEADQTDSRLKRAFSVKALAEDTANKVRTQKNAYFGQPGAKTNQTAWFCAILYHNWPAAADQYAAGTIGTWTFLDSDNNPKSMSDKALWVETASGGRLHTGYEWAQDYVRTKVVYVSGTWPA